MLLQAEATGLFCLSVVLAGPVSAALARADWPTRDPRAALVLWQAVGLGSGLGVTGAGLTLAAGALDNRWLTGIAMLPGHLGRLGVAGWAGVGLTLTIGVWLVVVGEISTARIVLARREHRNRLDTVAETLDSQPGDRVQEASADGSSPSATSGSDHSKSAPQPGWAANLVGVRLVDHPYAVAYCLPGLRPRVVLSSGALMTFRDDELAAVLAHERAHAHGHHDLVVQPFVAWAATFPFLPTAPRALSAVELLVEMLADDAARRTCRAESLQRALQHLYGNHVTLPGYVSTSLSTQLAARTSRLAGPSRPLLPVMRTLIYLAAVALILLPPAILLFS